MKRFGMFLFLMVVLLGSAWAESPEPYGGWGYAYASAGAVSSGGGSTGVTHFGGGGAGLLTGGLGAGIELGYMTPFKSFSSGIGVLSPGLLYAFNRESKTVPYVSGGYTLFFRSGAVHGFHFAGGVNHWLNDKWGIQIEGRDNVMPEYNEHIVEVRFGVLIN